MTSFSWVLVVLFVVGVAVLTGIKPRGSKPVEDTSLMTVARIVFVVLAMVMAYVILR